MNIQITLAVRYLLGRKLRTTLTTLAVVFGVMLVFGLNGVFPGVLGAMQKAMLASVGEVDLAVTSVSGASFGSELADTIAAVDGVEAAAPSLRRTMALPADGEYGISTLIVVGVDPELGPQVSPVSMDGGRYLAADNDPQARELVLPSSVAERMDLVVGDRIDLPSASGTTQFEVVGTADVVSLPGAEEAFVSLSAAQELFALQDRISEVDAAISPNADRSVVEAAVAEAVGSRFDVGGVSTDSPVAGGLKIARSIITMFGLFAFAMAGFIIYNTFRTTAAERRHDIGMLRAVGASRRTILGLFLAEGLAQGVIGTMIGLLAGWGVAIGSLAAINSIIGDLVGLSSAEVEFGWETWATAIGLGVGVAVFAALIPARSAARVTPLEALRPALSTDSQDRVSGWRGWIGLALIALAVGGLLSGSVTLVAASAVALLLGIAIAAPVAIRPISEVFGRAIETLYRREGGIARANLQRNAGRAAATATTVMVSVAVVIALLGTIASIFDGFLVYVDKSMGADYLMVPSNLLLSGGMVGAGPEFAEEVAATDGVAHVATMRIGRASHDDTNLEVVGIDPVAYPMVSSFEFADGSGHEDIALLAGEDKLMVNGVFAVRTGLEPGDAVDLVTPEGTRTFDVVAVGSDYLTAKLPTAYVSQSALKDVWGVSSDVLVMANVDEDANRGAVRAALEDTVARFPAFLLFGFDEWMDMQVTMLGQLEASMLVLAFVLAVPSFLALLNTLTIGVLARRREIGMLRAIGSTRKQIGRMVVAESLLLAALGTATGVVAGIWLSYGMTQAAALIGFTITTPYVFPWTGIATAVILATAFAGLAALLPSRQASRLDVVRSLRYE